MPVSDPLDSVYQQCGHCRCLLKASDIHVVHKELPVSGGPDEILAFFLCRDGPSCAARLWSRHRFPSRGVNKSYICIEEEDAALFRCVNCDAARTYGEVEVAVLTGDYGPFLEVCCKSPVQHCVDEASVADDEEIRERLKRYLKGLRDLDGSD